MPAYRSYYDPFSGTDGTTPAGWDTDAPNASAVITSSRADGGAMRTAGGKAVKFNYNSTGAFTAILKDINALHGQEILLNFWHLFDGNFSKSYPGGGSGAHMYKLISTSGRFWFVGFSNPGWFNCACDMAPGLDGANDMANSDLQVWQKMQFYANYTNGITRFFQQGTVILAKDGTTNIPGYGVSSVRNYSGERWETFYPISNWGDGGGPPTDDLNNIYITDVEIYTESAIGAATPADAGFDLKNGIASVTTGSPDGGGGSIVIPKFMMANRRRLNA